MMDKRFTPSYSYRAPRENAAGKPVGRALDFVFAAGWWFFFTELGHILITVLTKGCYCDFSLDRGWKVPVPTALANANAAPKNST